MKNYTINKLIIKLMCLLVLLLNIFVVISPIESYGEFKASTMISDLEKNSGKETSVATTTKNIVGTAINVIRIVGTGVAIIMITYVAIKYMSAAPQEKADFKKSATAMIVGAIVLFASTNILKLIANFATANT